MGYDFYWETRSRSLQAEVDRLMRCIDMAMGCLDPESQNRDEALAWYRLYDAEMGREPRASLERQPILRPSL